MAACLSFLGTCGFNTSDFLRSAPSCTRLAHVTRTEQASQAAWLPLRLLHCSDLGSPRHEDWQDAASASIAAPSPNHTEHLLCNYMHAHHIICHSNLHAWARERERESLRHPLKLVTQLCSGRHQAWMIWRAQAPMQTCPCQAQRSLPTRYLKPISCHASTTALTQHTVCHRTLPARAAWPPLKAGP